MRLFMRKQPLNTSASQKVAYVGRGMAEGALTCLATFLVLFTFTMLFAPVGAERIGNVDFWSGLFGSIAHQTLPTHPFEGAAYRFGSLFDEYPFDIAWRLALAFLPSAALGWFVFRDTATPRDSQVHVEGGRFHNGAEAVKQLAIDTAPPAPAKKAPTGLMKIHPDVPALPRDTWVRHQLIIGASGAGKTMILLHWLFQMRAAEVTLPDGTTGPYGHKFVAVDQKGDFSRLFCKFENGVSVGAALIDPWSALSDVWDIYRELSRDDALEVFCATMWPTNPNAAQPFFTDAAQIVGYGVVETLRVERRQRKIGRWGWTELSERTGLPQPGLVALFKPYAANEDGSPNPNYNAAINKAYNIVIDPNPGTMSVLSTLMNGAKLIDNLAKAWPTTIPNDTRRKIALCDWVKDDYTGPRQMVIRGKPDMPLTEKYIAAMFNVLAPLLLDLRENRHRFIGVIVDELAAVNRLNIMGLLDKGRSKGIMFTACYQDINQIKLKYSPEEANTMWSLVGTRIVTRTSSGDTANKLSEWFGKRVVNKMNTSVTANGQSAAQPNVTNSYHEEATLLVRPHQISDEKHMGVRSDSNTPYGFKVSGLLTFGGSVYKLWWPGFNVDSLVQCETDVPADWTKPMDEPEEQNQPETTAPAADADATEGGHEVQHADEPDLDIDDPMPPDDEPIPPRVVTLLDEPGEPEPPAEPPTAAKPAKAKPAEVDESDLDSMIEEAGEEIAADQLSEALDVPGLGVVLDVVKVVDMYHASNKPATPVGKSGQGKTGTTPLFR
ncbi:TPA: type IV secretion system DNA-binding domain-containing protein [Burkholderia contaminans]|uniref:type IV secretion system DNA-binding domain-containing protein n=1 Tax=Burkholderia contaminans TaxID=488447 RepID=UPI001CF55E91|nr:type IV secretion system DNA-binding domain-containing protein [Burkholderia contaminans]MCA7919401.1 type IV secretion system DNA-binding domain-containing protein [Burkholderia contaminans]